MVVLLEVTSLLSGASPMQLYFFDELLLIQIISAAVLLKGFCAIFQFYYSPQILKRSHIYASV